MSMSHLKQLPVASLDVLSGKSDVFTQHTEQETARKVPCVAGESPMKAMIDGPFGGKKPA